MAVLMVVLLLLQGCTTRTAKLVPNPTAPPNATPVVREVIPQDHLTRYDRFYREAQRVDTQASPWLDLLYETCSIRKNENGESFVYVDIVAFPKYQDKMTYWLYPELNEAQAAYLTEEAGTIADEKTSPGQVVDGPNTLIPLGVGTSFPLLPTVPLGGDDGQEAQVREAFASLKVCVVVEYNGRREKHIVTLTFVPEQKQ